MKLKANRLRDQLDVVELIKAGIDREASRSYLHAIQAAAEQTNE